MAVFRVERNTGYTVMSNHHLRNKELSLKAKGLLSQMLSLPEDWDYTLAGLSHINREKIDAIREAVKELEKAGYIVRSRERDEKGRLRGADYVIYEQPQPREPEAATSGGQPPILDLPTLENPTLDNPTLEKPTQEKPTLENPTQLNKDILSKEEGFSGLREIPLLHPEKGAAYGRTERDTSIPRQCYHDTEGRTDHRCGVVFQPQRHRNIPRQAAQSDTCRQLAGRSRAGKNENHAIGTARTKNGSPGRFLFENPHFPQVKSRENSLKNAPLSKRGRRKESLCEQGFPSKKRSQTSGLMRKTR
ncbi:helix-turn-helix domain-containing protein [Anaerovoracaceae bacterium Sow4_D4]